MTDLPEWSVSGHGAAETKRRVERMERWVNQQLDLILENQIEVANSDLLNIAEMLQELQSNEMTAASEVEAAWRGDIGPLQRRFPLLKDFLVAPPKRKRMRLPKTDLVQFAANDEKRIRALWQAKLGRKNRLKDDPISARGIAARRWGVDEEDIARRLKPSGKRS
jgi:hypothetical protein